LSWGSLPFVPLDGANWPLSVAAQVLGVPEKDLRKGIRQQGIAPAGVIRMSDFRRSGRHPMAYPAANLISIAEGFRKGEPRS
jgi:hypothetical protein